MGLHVCSNAAVDEAMIPASKRVISTWSDLNLNAHVQGGRQEQGQSAMHL